MPTVTGKVSIVCIASSATARCIRLDDMLRSNLLVDPCFGDDLCLSIRQEMMRDPVLVPESGRSYERANIEAWLAENMYASFSSILPSV